MLISIITVCYQSGATVASTIASVKSQTYPHVEHIIVDGGSIDQTVDIIKANQSSIKKWISEPDRGIYDAMNKGLTMASGDIIGFLNADDVFADKDVLTKVALAFEDSNLQTVFGDIAFVKDGRIQRYYSSAHFKPDKFAYGYMPAHPSFYARKQVYQAVGNFRTDFQIAADYDLLMRILLVRRKSYKYLPMVFVHMAPGGVSNRSFASRIKLNQEIMKSCRDNQVPTTYLKIYLKYFRKLGEFLGAGPRI
jgi:glycosyltransferase involved in cell wall biosynthesis